MFSPSRLMCPARSLSSADLRSRGPVAEIFRAVYGIKVQRYVLITFIARR